MCSCQVLVYNLNISSIYLRFTVDYTISPYCTPKYNICKQYVIAITSCYYISKNRFFKKNCKFNNKTNSNFFQKYITKYI